MKLHFSPLSLGKKNYGYRHLLWLLDMGVSDPSLPGDIQLESKLNRFTPHCSVPSYTPEVQLKNTCQIYVNEGG